MRRILQTLTHVTSGFEGVNIHNTGLPNYSKGSWNCSYNKFSELLNISGQIELSQGSTIAGTTKRLGTIPSNIMKMIGSTGDQKIWSSLYVTRSDQTLEIQNLTIEQDGKISLPYVLNNVTYLNIQLTLSTSTWRL